MPMPSQPTPPARPASPPRCPAAPGTALDDGIATADVLALLAASGDGLIQVDRRGRLRQINAPARQMLGLADQAAAAGQPRLRLGLARKLGRPGWRALVRALAQSGTWSGALDLAAGDTAAAPDPALRLVIVATPDTAGRVAGHLALLRPPPADPQAQREIQRQADILTAITEAIPATVVVVDGEGRYRFANRAFEQYSGFSRAQILGRRATDILGPEEVARRRPFMQRALAGEAVNFVLDYPGPQGTRWLSMACIPLRVAGHVDGFVGISQDVTQAQRERDRLEHLAERDALTGLLNRGGFERRVERLVQLGGDPAMASLALLYIDLDHFKPVNDTHGHLSGDRLLQLFAQRLLSAVRSSDVVARLGGDEFAILLPGVQQASQAQRVAEKVLAAIREPFDLGPVALHMGASIGIAVGPPAAANWRELIGRADTMLYQAKALGRGRAAI